MTGRTTARIVVVGLGPGGLDHVTVEAVAAIERIPVRFLRTGRHPSAKDIQREIRGTKNPKHLSPG